MNTNLQNIGKAYLSYLERNETDKIVALFSDDGIVNSPIYGIMPAKEFFKTLSADTSNSKLKLLGIFVEPNAARIVLYFNYEWTLANQNKVKFDVVDVMTFDADDKIVSLHIIYDTVKSKPAVDQLKP
ncbi:nuclear transport factor 2 family protein [Geojedonia litorea]|uniref:Nuclear transport factor 2 family protein n=1 Tax=Geojedonia litorea TaxID=1268269 RepID=A0ABV9N0D5_9FLAO